MNMRYVLQGQNQCGQACLAVLLGGKPLSEAVTLMGRRGYTRATHIDKALRRDTNGRLKLAKRRHGGPPMSGGRSVWLMAVHLRPKTPKWHWALVKLNGPNVEIVWPTKYPQHVKGLVESSKGPQLIESGWPPTARVSHSWRVVGA